MGNTAGVYTGAQGVYTGTQDAIDYDATKGDINGTQASVANTGAAKAKWIKQKPTRLTQLYDLFTDKGYIDHDDKVPELKTNTEWLKPQFLGRAKVNFVEQTDYSPSQIYEFLHAEATANNGADFEKRLIRWSQAHPGVPKYGAPRDAYMLLELNGALLVDEPIKDGIEFDKHNYNAFMFVLYRTWSICHDYMSVVGEIPDATKEMQAWNDIDVPFTTDELIAAYKQQLAEEHKVISSKHPSYKAYPTAVSELVLTPYFGHLEGIFGDNAYEFYTNVDTTDEYIVAMHEFYEFFVNKVKRYQPDLARRMVSEVSDLGEQMIERAKYFSKHGLATRGPTDSLREVARAIFKQRLILSRGDSPYVKALVATAKKHRPPINWTFEPLDFSKVLYVLDIDDQRPLKVRKDDQVVVNVDTDPENTGAVRSCESLPNRYVPYSNTQLYTTYAAAYGGFVVPYEIRTVDKNSFKYVREYLCAQHANEPDEDKPAARLLAKQPRLPPWRTTKCSQEQLPFTGQQLWRAWQYAHALALAELEKKYNYTQNKIKAAEVRKGKLAAAIKRAEEIEALDVSKTAVLSASSKPPKLAKSSSTTKVVTESKVSDDTVKTMAVLEDEIAKVDTDAPMTEAAAEDAKKNIETWTDLLVTQKQLIEDSIKIIEDRNATYTKWYNNNAGGSESLRKMLCSLVWTQRPTSPMIQMLKKMKPDWAPQFYDSAGIKYSDGAVESKSMRYIDPLYENITAYDILRNKDLNEEREIAYHKHRAEQRLKDIEEYKVAKKADLAEKLAIEFRVGSGGVDTDDDPYDLRQHLTKQNFGRLADLEPEAFQQKILEIFIMFRVAEIKSSGQSACAAPRKKEIEALEELQELKAEASETKAADEIKVEPKSPRAASPAKDSKGSPRNASADKDSASITLSPKADGSKTLMHRSSQGSKDSKSINVTPADLAKSKSSKDSKSINVTPEGLVQSKDSSSINVTPAGLAKSKSSSDSGSVYMRTSSQLSRERQSALLREFLNTEDAELLTFNRGHLGKLRAAAAAGGPKASKHILEIASSSDYDIDTELRKSASAENSEAARYKKARAVILAAKQLYDVGGNTMVLDFLGYQDFLRYYFTPASPFKGLLAWWGVGMGKTCAAVAALSYSFYSRYNIIWVTRKSLLTAPLKNMFQAACDREVRKALRDSNVDKAILDTLKAMNGKTLKPEEAFKLIIASKWIEQGRHAPANTLDYGMRVMTYKMFQNFCSPSMPEKWKTMIGAGGANVNAPNFDRLQRTVVVVDEAHNLFNSIDLGNDEINLRNGVPDLHDVEQTVLKSYTVSPHDSCCRILLLTGTPILADGEPTSLFKLLNLLREPSATPAGKKGKYEPYFPTTSEGLQSRYEIDKSTGAISDAGRQKFMSDTKGLISYVFGENQPDRIAKMDYMPSGGGSGSAESPSLKEPKEPRLQHMVLHPVYLVDIAPGSYDAMREKCFKLGKASRAKKTKAADGADAGCGGKKTMATCNKGWPLSPCQWSVVNKTCGTNMDYGRVEAAIKLYQDKVLATCGPDVSDADRKANCTAVVKAGGRGKPKTLYVPNEMYDPKCSKIGTGAACGKASCTWLEPLSMCASPNAIDLDKIPAGPRKPDSAGDQEKPGALKFRPTKIAEFVPEQVAPRKRRTISDSDYNFREDGSGLQIMKPMSKGLLDKFGAFVGNVSKLAAPAKPKLEFQQQHADSAGVLGGSNPGGGPALPEDHIDSIKSADGKKKFATCIQQTTMCSDSARKFTSLGYGLDYYKRLPKALDTLRTAKTTLTPKITALINAIEERDAYDMATHGRVYKHVVYTDVTDAFHGIKLVANVFLARGYFQLKLKNKDAQASSRSKKMWVYGDELESKDVPKEYKAKMAPVRDDALAKKRVFIALTSGSFKGPACFMPGAHGYKQDTTLSPDMLASIKQVAFDRFNSRPDNVYGDDVRFLLFDKGFKEGVDVFDAKYIWILEPPASQGALVQTVGRIMRMCGANGLKYPDEWVVHCTIFSDVIPAEGERAMQQLYTFQVGSDQKAAAAMRNLFLELGQKTAADRYLFKAMYEASADDPSGGVKNDIINFLAIP